ncbi:hypothetical protein Q4E93_21250 [Flavitalea sp. BT771]|uniref:hypothetical protein n=1 Tax=Flavitalea sp. BT771 TaxID=3063329 RepID=UPI0026E3308B|nr:hypothetical protein [Flavitalea sp. BT771]MDO6433150.1 hypothetical protein [Flavitalea sp. BT771]MDV6221574.1 hypothetical protein [Flavitalea sp. BT771]
MIFNWIWLVVLIAAGCKRDNTLPDKSPTKVVIQDSRLKELSGIAASIASPDVLYVHNDSGDSARFFAISPQGQLLRICYFKGDPKLGALGVKDCEDIAVSIGPVAGASYVYMADIGDNDHVRKYITIYRIKEPGGISLGSATAAASSQHLDADPLFLRYPDGPRDAETLLADPIDQLLYVVSKREDSVSVYSTPLNFKAHDTLTLTWRAKLHFEGSGQAKWITAGDISQDGGKVLLKSYSAVYFWQRKAGEAVWQTLLRSPVERNYEVERQGEAIGFARDGKGYYTTSEGVRPFLYYYAF